MHVTRASGVMLALGIGIAAPAMGSTIYTPLAFGPLTAPGGSLYYTEVYDITPDGKSYVGLLNNNTPRWVDNGTTYTTNGPGGAIGMSANGQVAVGGLSGDQRLWNINDAAGSNIPNTVLQLPSGFVANGLLYGTNQNATAFNLITNGQPAVLHNGQIFRPNDAFTAVNPQAFAGANRGMAQFAPIVVTLGFVPGVNANAYRVNYETSELDPLFVPAGASSTAVGGGASGAQLSADASIVGGSATFPSEGPVGQPIYWDADGTPHRIPGVGGRIFGTMNAANYTGTLLGGGLLGPGLQNNAVLYDIASDTTLNLNDVFADVLPDGWILTFTLHISDDGSRIFTKALAPDGTARVVVLEGEYVPAPGAVALLAMAGAAATRRRRR
ncbi:MAG: hypothetical protein ACTS3F_03025 [Phycisphaerales bacterium]